MSFKLLTMPSCYLQRFERLVGFANYLCDGGKFVGCCTYTIIIYHVLPKRACIIQVL